MENVCKYIGYLLIIVACSGIGICYGEEFRRYLSELEELKKIFCLVRSELEYVKMPFVELFEKLESRVTDPFRMWIVELKEKLQSREQGDFWEIWCSTIAENLCESRLKEEDLEELKLAGKSLEYTDNITLYIEQLEFKIEQVRQVYHTKRKLSRIFGIIGGVFLVILLL